MELPQFAPGSSARVESIVTDADTAQALGSGDVPVLGTPRVLALAETATVLVTSRTMPDGLTTVGVRAEIDHLAPTAVGRTVTATATLTGSAGRTLSFAVSVRAGDETVAEVRVDRMLLDRRRFIERASGQPS